MLLTRGLSSGNLSLLTRGLSQQRLNIVPAANIYAEILLQSKTVLVLTLQDAQTVETVLRLPYIFPVTIETPKTLEINLESSPLLTLTLQEPERLILIVQLQP